MESKYHNNLFREFANTHRLRLQFDECGDPIAEGRFGHLYQDSGRIGCCLLHPKSLRKNKLLRLCEKHPGRCCILEGDFEALFLFEANDEKFLNVALRCCEIRRKRKLPKKTRQRLARQGFQTNEKSPNEHTEEAIPAPDFERLAANPTLGVNLDSETVFGLQNSPGR